jgi:hypothetical protein
MVAADEVHAVGVAELEADEKGDGFDAEEASVDVVACEFCVSPLGCFYSEC